jgi:hypothetical protein
MINTILIQYMAIYIILITLNNIIYIIIKQKKKRTKTRGNTREWGRVSPVPGCPGWVFVIHWWVWEGGREHRVILPLYRG